jgi:hypothetical protein
LSPSRAIDDPPGGWARVTWLGPGFLAITGMTSIAGLFFAVFAVYYGAQLLSS